MLSPLKNSIKNERGWVYSYPSVESPWTQWAPWTLSMDFLDIAHGFPGHFPWSQWTVWTISMGSVDKVQWVQADWTVSKDNIHWVPGQSPWYSVQCRWFHWTKSRVQLTLSMDIVQPLFKSLDEVSGTVDIVQRNNLDLENFQKGGKGDMTSNC